MFDKYFHKTLLRGRLPITHSTATNRGNSGVLRTLCFLSFLVGLVFLILWPLSFRYYTTLGIDSEMREHPGTIYSRYYRIRWPGDGSFRIGGGGFSYGYPAKGSKEPQIFDLGGRFFQPPRRDNPNSFLNQVGFWWIASGALNNSDGNPWQFWVGVPSFLPPVFFGWLGLFCWRSIRRKAIAAKRRLVRTR